MEVRKGGIWAERTRQSSTSTGHLIAARAVEMMRTDPIEKREMVGQASLSYHLSFFDGTRKVRS